MTRQFVFFYYAILLLHYSN